MANSTSNNASRRKTASKSVVSGDNVKVANKLTEKEVAARKMKKYATTTFGFSTRNAYDSFGGSNTIGSQYGNFYSPQLSTDFLEKPQNLRERRSWYRHFYTSNEFVKQAIDLHSTLPLSKLRLEKPKCENQNMADYVYDYFVEMCEEINLFKSLIDISHEYWLLGNAVIFCQDSEPYKIRSDEDVEKVNQLKEYGRLESERLFKEFKIVDRDPNYKGWEKLIVLPPDQVRIKKVPLSDDSLIEFIPDPETRKSILHQQDGAIYDMSLMMNRPEDESRFNPEIPTKLVSQLRDNGSIPLDTDPFSGSYAYHLARKKCQYETWGVSILESCINTLLLQDKLRQAQTQIASRHMTPIRIVWAEELSEADVEALREQVDLALVDPDFSIITNYQVNWEEMGSNGRLLELSTEYEHMENSLFAGLGVTREILTGEGSYAGNRVTLDLLNNQYTFFREMLQDFVENGLFKPIARKKGFTTKDKFGREKLLYPKLSFTRLSIRDNDTFFDQAMQLYNKGSISVDVILDMLNIDPVATKKKIEADLFTVNDFAFNQYMIAMYNAAASTMTEQYNINERIGQYLDLQKIEVPQGGAEGGLGAPGEGDLGGGGMPRFAKQKVSPDKKAAIKKMVELAVKNPNKLEEITKYLNKREYSA